MDDYAFRDVETADGTSELAAEIDQFRVVVSGDQLRIVERIGDGVEDAVLTRTVQSYGGRFYDDLEGFVRRCDGHCRLAYVETANAGRIIYLYDHRPLVELVVWPNGDPIDPEDRGYYDGGNFAYCCNLDVDYFSEWGTCTFVPMSGEDEAGMFQRQRAGYERMLEVFGDAPVIDTSGGIVELRG